MYCWRPDVIPVFCERLLEMYTGYPSEIMLVLLIESS